MAIPLLPSSDTAVCDVFGVMRGMNVCVGLSLRKYSPTNGIACSFRFLALLLGVPAPGVARGVAGATAVLGFF